MLDLGGRRSGETSLTGGVGSKNKDYGEVTKTTIGQDHGHQIIKTAR
jgi:hypothetical protein